MAIQRVGVSYQLSIDFQTIDTTAYALIVIGRYDLAKEFLLATGQPEDKVNESITNTIERLKQEAAEQAAQQNAEAEAEAAE